MKARKLIAATFVAASLAALTACGSGASSSVGSGNESGAHATDEAKTNDISCYRSKTHILSSGKGEIICVHSTTCLLTEAGAHVCGTDAGRYCELYPQGADETICNQIFLGEQPLREATPEEEQKAEAEP